MCGIIFVLFYAVFIPAIALAEPTPLEINIQAYCEQRIRARLGDEGLWVTRWKVESVLGDTAYRSTSYIEWERDDGSDHYRADCIVHDDHRRPPSVVVVNDPMDGGVLVLEARE